VIVVVWNLDHFYIFLEIIIYCTKYFRRIQLWKWEWSPKKVEFEFCSNEFIFSSKV